MPGEIQSGIERRFHATSISRNPEAVCIPIDVGATRVVSRGNAGICNAIRDHIIIFEIARVTLANSMGTNLIWFYMLRQP